MLFISKIIFIFLFSNISPLLFILKEGEERCIIDEFIEKSYFVVKHKFFTEDKRDLKVFLPNFHFYVREAETNKIVYQSYFSDVKDKISRKVEKSGLYKICVFVNNHLPKDLKKMTIYANLRITSDNMDKNDFTNAIKSEDAERMESKADNIMRIINHASEIQNEQINVENEHSLDTLANAKMYKYFSFGQVIVAALIGLVQLNNFRRFLKSRNVV